MTPATPGRAKVHLTLDAADVYLALGANLGDRQAQIEAAAARLDAAGVAVQALSPLYETDAVADEPQPPYLNAAARARTALPPHDLLSLCLEIERALGRTRPAGRPKAPRTIDIDILLYGDRVIDDAPALIVPHPAMLARSFVRIPLRDVAAPGLRHPRTGDALDRATPDAGVRPYTPARSPAP
jgi:2-amino-4-hydroxy-6-hydroxymethyldihydropteridine diphosphokinase